MGMNCRHVRTSEELEQAFDVRKTVFVEEQQVPLDLELDEYDATVNACRHYIAESDGKTVGAARFREYEPGTAKLQRIAVLKPWRGSGVGKLLVETMERDAAALGYRKSVLDAQCAAEAFYRKLGYATESAEPFLDAGIPHVRMSKALAD
ncbi:GNAT family N-acetyltransferase [Cohnella sp. CFH 77786]|uniref:GNAT family N-acetyltransferase n=1 Tax=Cohnella sp. CFH 77786 TaxID=2662265 RepID=UPI001C610302|nr:GNAT family N-acetyltransferase [Cohnella sp. CFH 77786]MBW5448121.1 GNAT family N-acetyltransferase [Cohnella sp. CFH 77786]